MDDYWRDRMHLKILRENPMTGVRTFAIHPNDWPLVEKFYHDRGLNPADHIRNHRVNSAGQHTFRGGLGYDVIDADLLGGTGDGRLHREFERTTGRYVNYSDRSWPRNYGQEVAARGGVSEGEKARLRDMDKALGTARSAKPTSKGAATSTANTPASVVKPAVRRAPSAAPGLA
ncbi:hypothetical protein [Varibaculum cambriense]|uniref:Uncharacterized protein n=1 Tax=Varibaculum cambriense TaxID=184870 RepID=A0ABX4UNZ5_9ACTO|nr:hypothetical protein [Varibaculum cambriense]PMB89424.1 hypothetical protein CJ240_06560 [Varibaculum cambriense]